MPLTSDAGVDPAEDCVVCPDSRFTDKKSDGGEEHQILVANSVSLSVNALWEHRVFCVTLPVHIIFDLIPIPHQLISEWLDSTNSKIGGLIYPQHYLDVESKVPKVHIKKHYQNVAFRSGVDTSIQVDICLYIFRREMDQSSELQSFDHTVWNPFSYAEWWYMYTEFAPVVEEESDATFSELLPSGGCTLFRRMMHTHFNDCGLVLGKIWWEFGLGKMVKDSGHEFTRRMLLGFELFTFRGPNMTKSSLFSPSDMTACLASCRDATKY